VAQEAAMSPTVKTLYILRMLQNGAARVTMREVLGLSDRAVSRHLKYIRYAGWDVSKTYEDGVAVYRLETSDRAGSGKPPDIGLTPVLGGARGVA